MAPTEDINLVHDYIFTPILLSSLPSAFLPKQVENIILILIIVIAEFYVSEFYRFMYIQ